MGNYLGLYANLIWDLVLFECPPYESGFLIRSSCGKGMTVYMVAAKDLHHGPYEASVITEVSRSISV